MKSLLIITLLLTATFSKGQEKHDHPDHPKGNSADQYEALPYYNEACEFWSVGDTASAKRELYKAITISFALTEAQLFLADILKSEGKIDSAFIFYNSGIDFAIEQKPHFYFSLFETGHVLGQYAIMQHNLKNFHKLYKKDGFEKPYEEGYSYDRSDYEYWESTLAFVYNYENWTPTGEHVETIAGELIRSNGVCDSYIDSDPRLMKRIERHGKFKSKKLKSFRTNDYYLSLDNDYMIFTQMENDSSKLYIGRGKGFKVISELVSCNFGSWQGTPFVSSNGNVYFSSNKNGNKDLFVGKLNEDLTEVQHVQELSRINTDGDETSLFIDEKNSIIYFSSNGMVGFGGHDIYKCTDFETINDVILPFNARNAGASFNSHHDELWITVNSISDHFILNRLTHGRIESKFLAPVEKDSFNYLLTSPEIQY